MLDVQRCEFPTLLQSCFFYCRPLDLVRFSCFVIVVGRLLQVERFGASCPYCGDHPILLPVFSFAVALFLVNFSLSVSIPPVSEA